MAQQEKKQPKAKSKKKVKTFTPSAIAHIKATYNNTIVTITDQQGNTLAWASAGAEGFKGPKKSTPFAAGIVVKSIMQKVADYGVKEIDILVKGVGSGREGAIRAFNARGMNIISIKDATSIPHNGPRPRKVRRV